MCSFSRSKRRKHGSRMRLQRLVLLLVIASIVGLSLVLLNKPASSPPNIPSPAPFERDPPPDYHNIVSTLSDHPISKLVSDAESQWKDVVSRQSKTLAEAVREYRRRYQMAPPPNFDKWFQFAQAREVKLIDEYDTIYHSLLPFWGLEPKTIRQRAREAMGFDNAVIGLLIRDGKVTKIEGGGDGRTWQREATVGMMDGFVKYLPDMDLVFNTHDEPRVVVPSDDLQRLVSIAKNGNIPTAFENPSPYNAWSERPADLNSGQRINEVRTTRFNKFAHQPTWTNSRSSCPVESPARSLDEQTPDNVTAYAYSDLGFIYNTTAFSDICFSPSLQNTFGFFDRPNAFDVVHDLFPIFSQSKISSFQDILYPSPWYWNGKVAYEEDKDFDWAKKQDKMYWRGSTTGGFSRDGGWRRQHRQLFVKKVNGLDNAKILEKSQDGDSWDATEVSRRDYKNSFDVKFTYVGQCDPDDCAAQEEFFNIVEAAGQQEAWGYRYLVDIDGNAFSGRYYAFLHSNSLVLKLAVFREWHNEWIKPWVHYVPLSMHGDDYVEIVRYFDSESEGKKLGPRLAQQGKDWASKALRNEDLEVWFFRLLLEYGRIVDDNRDKIGYSLP